MTSGRVLSFSVLIELVSKQQMLQNKRLIQGIIMCLCSSLKSSNSLKIFTSFDAFPRFIKRYFLDDIVNSLREDILALLLIISSNKEACRVLMSTARGKNIQNGWSILIDWICSGYHREIVSIATRHFMQPTTSMSDK